MAVSIASSLRLCILCMVAPVVFSAETSGASIILDDRDAQFSESQTVCAGAGDVHNAYFSHNAGLVSRHGFFAAYEFEVKHDGCYLIEERHPTTIPAECGKFKLSSAPFRVDFCKGEVAYARVDQRTRGGHWNVIGWLPFFVGHFSRIAISQEGFSDDICPDDNCFWAADAFRLSWFADTCNDTEARRAIQNRLAAEEQEDTERPKDEAAESRSGTSTTSTSEQPAESHGEPVAGGRIAEDSTTSAASYSSADGPVSSTPVSRTGATTVQAHGERSNVTSEEPASEANAQPTGLPTKGVDLSVLEVGEGSDSKLLVQVVLEEASQVGLHAIYEFRPPLHGCYLVEEYHRYASEGSKVPISLTYGEGLYATGFLKHGAETHRQWNYIATLPFLADRNASVALPLRMLHTPYHTQPPQQLRFTHLGRSSTRCATGGDVQQARLRIAAPFSNIADKQEQFKAAFTSLLARAAEVDVGRIRVPSLRAGSILADVLVYPQAAVVDATRKGISAGDALWKLWGALEPTAVDGIGGKVCALAGSTALDCRVLFESSGKAIPLVQQAAFSEREDAEDPDDESPKAAPIEVILPPALFGTLLLASVVYICGKRKLAALRLARAKAKKEALSEYANRGFAVGMPLDMEQAKAKGEAFQPVPRELVADDLMKVRVTMLPDEDELLATAAEMACGACSAPAAPSKFMEPREEACVASDTASTASPEDLGYSSNSAACSETGSLNSSAWSVGIEGGLPFSGDKE
eukprot:TRINITY_DN70543_c0_g1_i1.p1 TRINITY_DN70543_c0_g1~~TRINITY_DN70543_c0_g1_i1.p1  ORF type:complete len:751 (+),score=131.30 TRINITY_DN70543_c0_g1_i1:84-2336(+)